VLAPQDAAAAQPRYRPERQRARIEGFGTGLATTRSAGFARTRGRVAAADPSETYTLASTVHRQGDAGQEVPMTGKHRDQAQAGSSIAPIAMAAEKASEADAPVERERSEPQPSPLIYQATLVATAAVAVAAFVLRTTPPRLAHSDLAAVAAAVGAAAAPTQRPTREGTPTPRRARPAVTRVPSRFTVTDTPLASGFTTASASARKTTPRPSTVVASE
jgi:hypothetical protein